MSEESERAFRHRVEQLALLADVEAFKVLARECEKTRERMIEQVTRLLLDPDVPLESLEQQRRYNIGFIAGMRYATTGVPSGAARTLERLNRGQDAPDEPEQDFWSYEQPEVTDEQPE